VRSALGLYVLMLRYRVAAMMWMFLLLGAAGQGTLDGMPVGLVWATLVLGSAYVSATTVNDVADRDIDRVNHPRDRGRPLVTGEATEPSLLRLHRVAAALALLAAVPLGAAAIGIVTISLLIGWAYSVGPVRFSYRTYLAPLVLAVAYVLVPYALGLVVAGVPPNRADAWLAGSLFILFIARINLKDFRDREGDARYGKPTVLLRYGKETTCAVSLAALLIANVLLVVALRPPILLALMIEALVAFVAYLLLQLRAAQDPHAEQVAIGIAARLGNGLLICVLAWLLLSGTGAPEAERLAFVAILASLYTASAVVLLGKPQEVVLGYKG
jgi:4-hydroxybenzoate polyprenyltransferase